MESKAPVENLTHPLKDDRDVRNCAHLMSDFVERWIDITGDKAEVCFRNTDTERSIAYTRQGRWSLTKCQIWAIHPEGKICSPGSLWGAM